MREVKTHQHFSFNYVVLLFYFFNGWMFISSSSSWLLQKPKFPPKKRIVLAFITHITSKYLFYSLIVFNLILSAILSSSNFVSRPCTIIIQLVNLSCFKFCKQSSFIYFRLLCTQRSNTTSRKLINCYSNLIILLIVSSISGYYVPRGQTQPQENWSIVIQTLLYYY